MEIAEACAEFDGLVWMEHKEVGIREHFRVRTIGLDEIVITLQFDGQPEDTDDFVVVRLVGGCASMEAPLLSTGFSDAVVRRAAILGVAAHLMDLLEGER